MGQISSCPETKIEYQRQIATQVGCAPERYSHGFPRRVVMALYTTLLDTEPLDKEVPTLRCEIAHHIGMTDPDRLQNKHRRFRKRDLIELHERLVE